MLDRLTNYLLLFKILSVVTGEKVVFMAPGLDNDADKLSQAANQANVKTVAINNKAPSNNSFAKGDDKTVLLLIEGNLAQVMMVTAAGVWHAVAFKGCGLCMTAAGGNVPACVICGVGMLGTVIWAASWGVMTNGWVKTGTVSAQINVKRDVDAKLNTTQSFNGTHTFTTIYDANRPNVLQYVVNDGTRTYVYAHAQNGRQPGTAENMHKVAEQSKKDLFKRDTYEIDWISYEYDDYNTYIGGFFFGDHSQDDSFINEYATSVFAAGGTS